MIGCKSLRHQNMVGCQNYGPFLGTLIIRCRNIIGIQKNDHNFDNHPYHASTLPDIAIFFEKVPPAH